MYSGGWSQSHLPVHPREQLREVLQSGRPGPCAAVPLVPRRMSRGAALVEGAEIRGAGLLEEAFGATQQRGVRCDRHKGDREELERLATPRLCPCD